MAFPVLTLVLCVAGGALAIGDLFILRHLQHHRFTRGQPAFAPRQRSSPRSRSAPAAAPPCSPLSSRKRSVPWSWVSGFCSVNTAARGTATTLSAAETGISMFAVMPGRTRRSAFFDHDPDGKTFDVVLERGLRRNALDLAHDLQPGHRFHLRRYFLPHLQPGNIRLVDVRVDDHLVQVGDGQNFGPAAESARPGDRLTDRDGPGQYGAIERSDDPGFRSLSLTTSKALSARSSAFLARSYWVLVS